MLLLRCIIRFGDGFIECEKWVFFGRGALFYFEDKLLVLTGSVYLNLVWRFSNGVIEVGSRHLAGVNQA